MADGDKLTLDSLLVADLKRELAARNQDVAGTKGILKDRLRQCLMEDGLDPEEFSFVRHGDSNPLPEDSLPQGHTSSAGSSKSGSSGQAGSIRLERAKRAAKRAGLRARCEALKIKQKFMEQELEMQEKLEHEEQMVRQKKERAEASMKLKREEMELQVSMAENEAELNSLTLDEVSQHEMKQSVMQMDAQMQPVVVCAQSDAYQNPSSLFAGCGPLPTCELAPPASLPAGGLSAPGLMTGGGGQGAAVLPTGGLGSACLATGGVTATGLPARGQGAAGLPAGGLRAPGLMTGGMGAAGLLAGGLGALGLMSGGLGAPGLLAGGQGAGALPADRRGAAGLLAGRQSAAGLVTGGRVAAGLSAGGLGAPGLMSGGLGAPGLPSGELGSAGGVSATGLSLVGQSAAGLVTGSRGAAGLSAGTLGTTGLVTEHRSADDLPAGGLGAPGLMSEGLGSAGGVSATGLSLVGHNAAGLPARRMDAAGLATRGLDAAALPDGRTSAADLMLGVVGAAGLPTGGWDAAGPSARLPPARGLGSACLPTAGGLGVAGITVEEPAAVGLPTEARELPAVSSSFAGPQTCPDRSQSSLASQDVLSQLARQLSRNMLPPAEVPMFDGDVMHYPSFQRAFEARIARRSEDPGEMLYYLDQHVTGKAKELVRSAMHLEPAAAYREAWRLLERRYGCPTRVAHSYIERVASWPPVKASVALLDDFSIFLVGCKNAMQNIPGLEELDNPQIMKTVVEKLPSNMQERWRRVAHHITQTEARRLKFEDLVEFVDKEAAIARDPVFGREEPKEAHGGRMTSSNVTKRSSFATSAQSTAAMDSSRGPRRCYFCNGPHLLHICDSLSQRSMEERTAFVRDRGLCFGCLGAGHVISQCRRRSICRVCNGRHVTLFHDDDRQTAVKQAKEDRPSTKVACRSQEEAQRPSVGVQVSNAHVSAATSEGGGSMNIVPVKIFPSGRQARAVTTYAFLDNGSSASFIDSALLAKLDVPST